jgi:disulfide oxidoreductase YuzD
LMLIPAFFTFSGVLNESKFKNSANEFLRVELDGLKNKDYLEQTAIINYNYDNMSSNFVWPWSDKKSKIVLNTFGLEPVSKETIDLLKAKLKKYPNLSLTEIIFNQLEIENDFKEQKRFLSELRYRDSLDLINKSSQIEILTKKINRLEKIENNNLFYQSILNEVKFNYQDIEEFNYLMEIWPNDTIPVFTVKWSEDVLEQNIINQEDKLKKWLFFKLSNESFELIRK